MTLAADRLRERYGARPAGGRRRRWPLVLAAIALVAVVAIVGGRYAYQPVRYQSVGYEHASAHSIDLTFQVTMRPGSRARCTVQALDRSRGQVGFREITVGPESAAQSLQRVAIATQGAPVTAEVIDCDRA